MKKVLIVAGFAIISFLIYSTVFKTEEPEPVFSYNFDFEKVDRDFWLVGKWDSFDRNYDAAKVNDGKLILTSNDSQHVPYILSKPIAIRQGDVITVKRRVKISHNDEYFSGGMVFFQTDDEDIIPTLSDSGFDNSFGDGIALIEYSYDFSKGQERPGKDVIRFLAADWEYNDNYVLINPIYDEWIDETFTFDTRTSQMTYEINGTSYKLNSYKLDRNYIRVLMHAYGKGYGNEVAIDDIDITVENQLDN